MARTLSGVFSRALDGVHINQRTTFRYGKVTYKFSGPAVPGVVSAAILIGTAAQRDEIDVELVGGDPAHWQTNVFAPTAQDPRPLFGTFSSVEDVPGPEGIPAFHKYSIDWNDERIIWAVDGKDVRTLERCESKFVFGLIAVILSLFFSAHRHLLLSRTLY